jgi:proteasome accessory factor C
VSGDLPRLLALVPYLLARPGAKVAEVAEVFGVTEKRLRADLDLLWVCGLPGHGPGDLIDLELSGDTVTLFEPAGVTRPLRLTVDEALALVVALRALVETPGLDERDAVDRVLAKVERVAGAAALPAGRVEVALNDPGAAEARALPVVRDALERGRRLHLAYHVPARDETTEREVDPLRLLLVEGHEYLEAWDRGAEGTRLFRLDRVERATVLDAPSEPPPGVPQRDLAQGLFQPSPDDALVTLRLRPGAHWVADYHPCESVEQGEDGDLVVGLRTAGTDWVRRLALRLGGQGQVLAPPELAEQVREDARAALSAYTDRPTRTE